MRTALRKMGNSTGMIVPKAILGQLGLASGAALELVVDGDRLVATPIVVERRFGWADAAAAIGAEPDAAAEDWLAAPLSSDDDLEW